MRSLHRPPGWFDGELHNVVESQVFAGCGVIVGLPVLCNGIYLPHLHALGIQCPILLDLFRQGARHGKGHTRHQPAAAATHDAQRDCVVGV